MQRHRHFYIEEWLLQHSARAIFGAHHQGDWNNKRTPGALLQLGESRMKRLRKI